MAAMTNSATLFQSMFIAPTICPCSYSSGVRTSINCTSGSAIVCSNSSGVTVGYFGAHAAKSIVLMAINNFFIILTQSCLSLSLMVNRHTYATTIFASIYYLNDSLGYLFRMIDQKLAVVHASEYFHVCRRAEF